MNELKLSISAIKSFKACRRAYELRYVKGIIPVSKSEALETGSNYHEMIEQLARTKEMPALNTKEAGMVYAYAKYIHPDMPQYEPEVWFEKQFSKNNIIIGRADGIVEKEQAVVEHKTTSLSVEQFEFNLQYDEQLLTYFLATGFHTAYYTICRKPLIHQKKSETEEEFAQRVYEWYDEYTEDKIKLIKIHADEDELKEYKKSLRSIFSEIRRAEKNGMYYRNTCHCNAYNVRCEYASICNNYDPDQEYVGFNKRGGIYANN